MNNKVVLLSVLSFCFLMTSSVFAGSGSVYEFEGIVKNVDIANKKVTVSV